MDLERVGSASEPVRIGTCAALIVRQRHQAVCVARQSPRGFILNTYVLSAAVGLLVGVIYGALNVRSPAPPVIALIGLLGILAGEQIPALVRHWTQKNVQPHAIQEKVRSHVFGAMPGCEKTVPLYGLKGQAAAQVEHKDRSTEKNA